MENSPWTPAHIVTSICVPTETSDYRLPADEATIDDEIVADLLVKSILLRRLTKDRLATFIIEQIKPFMTSQDSMFLRRNIPTFSDFT